MEAFEPRDSGRWRLVQTDPDGVDHGFHGVFHGTPTPQSTVRTWEYEGVPGHVSLETVTMQERDGRTLVRAVTASQSIQDRDGMVAAGMDSGVHQSHERMAELLADLREV